MRSVLLLYKLRFFFAGATLVASIFLLSVVISSVEIKTVQAQEASTSSDALAMEMADDPNAVTGGLTMAMDSAGKTLNSATYAFVRGTQSTARSIVKGGKTMARGARVGAIAVTRGVGKGAVVVGRALGAGTLAVLQAPGKLVGVISDTSPVRAVIRPSDHVEVQVIDPNSPELLAALEALPPAREKNAAAKKTTKKGAGPKWPIHGTITTQFGVNHWPYQATHTGLDISDGQIPGVTPIKPFRPGRVIEVVHSDYSLGNHVIIDHGNGVTSVYGHLYSIAVEVGQEVALGTTLGTEGSTGVSTGTHLHFEVRVNGQAADPQQFIGGHP